MARCVVGDAREEGGEVGGLVEELDLRRRKSEGRVETALLGVVDLEEQDAGVGFGEASISGEGIAFGAGGLGVCGVDWTLRGTDGGMWGDCCL